LLAAAFMALMFFDAAARLDEFENAVSRLRASHAPQALAGVLAYRHRGSWCQREAVKAAAGVFGLRREAAEALYDRGYRWYHFLPDGSLRRNSPLLQVNFWTDLVGMKRT